MNILLWGNLKVYSIEPTNLEDLWQRLVRECRLLTSGIINNVRKAFEYRPYYCMQLSGGSFEKLIVEFVPIDIIVDFFNNNNYSAFSVFVTGVKEESKKYQLVYHPTGHAIGNNMGNSSWLQGGKILGMIFILKIDPLKIKFDLIFEIFDHIFFWLTAGVFVSTPCILETTSLFLLM